MSASPDINLWSSAEHALEYLQRADTIPHRVEGEATLLEFVPPNAKRILDLGSGGGRLLALVKAARPQAQFVGIDFFPTMLETAQKVFSGDRTVNIVTHVFANKLPSPGHFHCVFSHLATHHSGHEGKRTRCREALD